jgi:hypothetical protein
MKLSDFFRKIASWLRPQSKPEPIPLPTDSIFDGKVCLIVIDPILPTSGGRRLTSVAGWKDPDLLVQEFLKDLEEISYGFARYRIVESILVDQFPQKIDGFRYTEEEYLRVVRTRQGIHQPDDIDYQALLREHQIIEKINTNQIDEVWTISFPWAGFYESRMAGPGAYWCNSPALGDTNQAARRFIIMAFNYERGVGEMLESYGHRAESILARVFQKTRGVDNLWERFTRHELSHPGQAEVGNIHFAPNSRQDYDWGNPIPVLSRCRNWRSYPDLSTAPHMVTCQEWGGGDIRAHHRWWFSQMPHISGQSAGISYNWWEYIVNPNRFL